MVSIKIDDDLIADLMKERVKQNPYDADKKITHIVKEIIIKEILELREKNNG